MFRRVAHLIWGDDVDQALRPVLLVSLMGSVAGSSSWSFMGIWAVKELGATSGQLSFGYLVSAIVGGFVGYAGGHLSDLFGRRRLILAGDGVLAVYVLLFLVAGHNVLLGLGFAQVARKQTAHILDYALAPKLMNRFGGRADEHLVELVLAAFRIVRDLDF